jgi:hypothetical protein
MALSKAMRKYAAKMCDEEQQARFERAGMLDEWRRMSEVEAAILLGDVEFLSQAWIQKDPAGNPIIKPGEFVIDHIDNDDANNPQDGSNWCWLTRRENVLKNPPNNRTLRHKFRFDNNSEHYVKSKKEKDRESVNIGKSVLIRGNNGRQRGVTTYIFDDGQLIVRDAIMAKSLQFDDCFEKIAKRIMRRLKESRWDDVLYSICQEAKCKPQTGEKRLKMLCAPYAASAPFERETVGNTKIIKWKEKKIAGKVDEKGVLEGKKEKVVGFDIKQGEKRV